MFFAFNTRQATKLARSLEKALATQSLTLCHGQALDTLARMQGFADWNSWKCQLEESGWNQQLDSTEMAHARDSAGTQYDNEAALIAHTGFELRYDTDDELLTYVRVCDPLGRELAYWTHEEWQEDPQLVMGAIIGALVRGQPAQVRRGKTRAVPAPTQAKVPPAHLPLITDLDFFKAHAVVLDGRCYRIEWREEAALAYVGRTQASDYDEWADEVALQLHYEEDGLVWEETVTVEELNALQWSPEHKCFVGAQETSWRFFVETEFGADAPARNPVAQPSPVIPQEAQAVRQAKDEDDGKALKAPRRFRVTVNIRAEDGSCSPLGEQVCAAPTEAQACNLVREALWDERLNAASCSAQVEAEPLDDDEDGPFTVFVDGGEYDTMDSFAKAWRVAKFMLDESATEQVHIEDSNGDSVFELRL